jgi:hypothetical protein
MCERHKEREREGGRERAGERERERDSFVCPNQLASTGMGSRGESMMLPWFRTVIAAYHE